MNWQEVIKKISEEFPQLTPEKLYDYVKKTYGSDSDIKLLEKEWTRLVVRSIKNFKGVPDTEDRKKLSLNKRINYFIESPGFKWSWQLFHSQYYNDGPQEVCDEDGNPTGEIYNTGESEDEEVSEPAKIETGAAWPFPSATEPKKD